MTFPYLLERRRRVTGCRRWSAAAERGANIQSQPATILDGHPGRPEASRALVCVRAGAFALAGSVLAALGHVAVADGAVPWRFVSLLAGAQFIAVWPVARRRFSFPAALGCALAVQGVLHLVLTIMGERDPEGNVRAGHAAHGMPGHAAMADGPAWQHACTTLTAVHVLAAPAVAWLLHSADAAVVAAMAITRAVRGIAAAVAAWVRSLRTGVQVRPLPAVPLTEYAAPHARAWTHSLEHALVRRGPPGHAHVPSRPSPGRPPWGARLSRKEHLCVRAPRCPRRAVSPRPAPPR